MDAYYMNQYGKRPNHNDPLAMPAGYSPYDIKGVPGGIPVFPPLSAGSR
jgi:hypothetical protein